MLEAPHFSPAGNRRDSAFALPGEYFDGEVNQPVLHQAVKTFLNNVRRLKLDISTLVPIHGPAIPWGEFMKIMGAGGQ